METTVTYAPKTLSGVDVIDEGWGGLYRGGSYIVYGRAATGRGLLTIMFAQMGAVHEERCLFISPDRPKDLMIQAASIGFDLRQAHESGFVKLMRIPPMLNLQEVGDEGVAEALRDLVSIIRQNRPDRLVINDFMPFVQFRSFDRFRKAFVEMLEQIDSLDTTLELVMAEPANQQSRRVVDFMRSQMTGAIHIELIGNDAHSTKRRLTLIPNIGHIQRHVVEFWDLRDVVDDHVEGGVSTSPRMLPFSPERRSERPFAAIAAETQTRTAPQPVMPARPRSGSREETDDSNVRAIPLGGSGTHQPASPRGGTPSVEKDFTEPERHEEFPSLEAPQATTSTPAYDQSSHTDREAFRMRLQQQYLRRDVTETPFLLIAMRMDRTEERTARPFDFEFILDLVSELLREEDDMFAALDDERLIVLLAESGPDAAQQFFTRLKDRLREEAPHQADHLLHSVSAIVVPGGRPFQNAEEFLTYAMDEA